MEAIFESTEGSSSSRNDVIQHESLSEELSDKVARCNICQDRARDVRVQCGHVFCKMCLQQYSECQLCPVCKKQTSFLYSLQPSVSKVQSGVCASADSSAVCDG